MRRPATEAILTIAPPPRCFICGITACVPLKGPRRLTAMIRSQSALGISAIVWRVIVPAELTRISMPPARAVISEASRLKASPSATSSAWPVAPPPISDATFAAASPSRSMTATRAPDLARARQLAAPMPLPPPVTSAILPVRSIVILSSSLSRRQRPAWVEPFFDVGITQAAFARPNDIGRDRIGIEQDLDTLLVGRPIRVLPDHRRDIGIVEQFPILFLRLLLELRLAPCRNFRDRSLWVCEHVGEFQGAARGQVEQQGDARAVRMRAAAEGSDREDQRNQLRIGIAEFVGCLVIILGALRHWPLHLAVFLDRVLAKGDRARRLLEGGRRRAARRQHLRGLDRDLVAALARLVEQDRHNARRVSGAVRAFAGQETPPRLGFGAQALRERVVRFVTARGGPPRDPAPLIGEQRLLLFGRQFRAQRGIAVRHRLVGRGKLDIAADRLVRRGLRLPAIGHRLPPGAKREQYQRRCRTEPNRDACHHSSIARCRGRPRSAMLPRLQESRNAVRRPARRYAPRPRCRGRAERRGRRAGRPRARGGRALCRLRARSAEPAGRPHRQRSRKRDRPDARRLSQSLPAIYRGWLDGARRRYPTWRARAAVRPLYPGCRDAEFGVHGLGAVPAAQRRCDRHAR